MAGATAERSDLFSGPLRSIGDFVVEWFPLVVVTLLWELASGWAVGESVLPPPSVVFARVLDMLVTGSVLPDLLLSVYRVAWGLGLSIGVGVLLGIGMARSDTVEDFFEVFLALLYPVPKTALVPLALLWLGRGTGTAILIIFLACLLPVILNSYNAARTVDQNLIWSAQMMGTSDRRILWKIIVPDTVPEIVTGIRQAIPIAFIALTGAELIGANEGMGAIIRDSGQLGIYPRMFAAIVLISAAAFLALRGFDRLKRRVFVWT
jgi:ABC-type nitrate/sulfonate/bicarbonate transport system permease component